MTLRLVNNTILHTDSTAYIVVSYAIWQQEALSFINGLAELEFHISQSPGFQGKR